METGNTAMIEWLHRLGVADVYISWILRICAIIVILLVVWVTDGICRRLVFPSIRKFTRKTETVWDDYLLSPAVLKNIRRMIAPIIIYTMLPIAIPDAPIALLWARKICWIVIIIVTIKLICSFITSVYWISSEHNKLKNHALKGFYQMIKLIVVCIGGIIIISTLLDKNPTVILTGLGAGTAILMLVFQDTIKGLVAGIQLMANDMVRPGDWITMPKYGADGDVLEITLTTVKVQNWDKTITTVPPFALVNDSFQNWRGMFDIGGRRIKRSLNIDMSSIRFCTEEEMKKFRQQPWMEGFEATGKEEVNLHIFRHYIEYYLRNHPKVSKDLIMMVRQLQPTEHGMPIELYFFSASTAWVKYEQLQAEVFDHVIAMVHTFDLKVFQSPSGSDIKKLS